MVRWLRWHCPPDTGFEIRSLAVWGRARYLSGTEAPHNTEFYTWMGKKQFCFFQTAETGNRTPNSSVKGSGANHDPRSPAHSAFNPFSAGINTVDPPSATLAQHWTNIVSMYRVRTRRSAIDWTSRGWTSRVCWGLPGDHQILSQCCFNVLMGYRCKRWTDIEQHWLNVSSMLSISIVWV